MITSSKFKLNAPVKIYFDGMLVKTTIASSADDISTTFKVLAVELIVSACLAIYLDEAVYSVASLACMFVLMAFCML